VVKDGRKVPDIEWIGGRKKTPAAASAEETDDIEATEDAFDWVDESDQEQDATDGASDGIDVEAIQWPDMVPALADQETESKPISGADIEWNVRSPERVRDLERNPDALTADLTWTDGPDSNAETGPITDDRIVWQQGPADPDSADATASDDADSFDPSKIAWTSRGNAASRAAADAGGDHEDQASADAERGNRVTIAGLDPSADPARSTDDSEERRAADEHSQATPSATEASVGPATSAARDVEAESTDPDRSGTTVTTAQSGRADRTESATSQSDRAAARQATPTETADATPDAEPESDTGEVYVEPGSCTLFACSKRHKHKTQLCDHMLLGQWSHGGKASEGAPNVLMIRFEKLPERRLEQLSEVAANVKILAIGYSKPRAASEFENIDYAAIRDPGDLTRIGIIITRTIDDWARSEGPIAACFESLTMYLQYVGEQQLFQFLHILLSKLRQSDAAAHFHIDPSAHEPHVINTFGHLFDGTITVEDSGVTVDT
jgi:hypothetical protein